MSKHRLSVKNMSAEAQQRNLAEALLESAFADFLMGDTDFATFTAGKAIKIATAEMMRRYYFALALDSARRGLHDGATMLLRSQGDDEAATFAQLISSYCDSLGLDSFYAHSLIGFLANETYGESDETRRQFWLQIAYVTERVFRNEPAGILSTVLSLPLSSNRSSANHRRTTAPTHV